MTEAPFADPRMLYPQPPFEEQQALNLPASTVEMHPVPDHGEQSYQGCGRLAGARVLITGGDSGIGRAVAIAMAREGADVAVNYLSQQDDAEDTLKWIVAAGVKGRALQADLRKEEGCRRLVGETVDAFGGLDVLINNAAYQQSADELEDFSSEVFDRIMKTNLYAPFWLARTAVEHLTAGGSIINTVSIQGLRPSPELLPYAASKSALIGLTKAMAPLAMRHGVRVNGVAPGPVWTPIIPSTMPLEKAQNFGADTVFKRPAQPAELAPLYVWLASAEASYVTGEVFGATGGSTPL